MLLSGHKLNVPSKLGIVVGQQPLTKNDFAPFLEANASLLLRTGRCRWRTYDDMLRLPNNNNSDDGGPRRRFLVNDNGAQLFVTNDSQTPPAA